MKKIILMILLAVFLVGCTAYTATVPKEEIVSYYYSNTEELGLVLNKDIPKDYDQVAIFIDEHLGENSIVRDIYRYGEITEFECRGVGLNKPGTTSGFYHSPDNTPFAFEFKNHSLEERDEGVYFWESENGKKRIYTERIAENWFYYEKFYAS